MSESDRTAMLRSSAMRMGLLAICLQDFAVRIMAHVLRGGTLDDDSLAEIQRLTIAGLKTTTSEGMSDAQVAEAFKVADKELREFMAGAIARAHALKAG